MVQFLAPDQLLREQEAEYRASSTSDRYREPEGAVLTLLNDLAEKQAMQVATTVEKEIFLSSNKCYQPKQKEYKVRGHDTPSVIILISLV